MALLLKMLRGPAAALLGALVLTTLTPLGCRPGLTYDDEPPARLETPGCINACYYDERPAPVDCAQAEAGLEFYPLSIWSMERDGVASNMYSYWDATTRYLSPSAWEPPANSSLEDPGAARQDSGSFQRCLDDPTNGVLHLYGGPFQEWGGGVGRAMKCLNGSPLLGEIRVGTDTWHPSPPSPDDGTRETDASCGSGPDNDGAPRFAACQPDSPSDPASEEEQALIKSACPARDRDAQADGRATAGEDEFLLGMTLDLSDWDGISFWARRSPNSQSGIRIAVGDKRTDDDLRYLQYHVNPDAKPYCERNRECGCPNRRTCREFDHPTAGVECTKHAHCNKGSGELCDLETNRCTCRRDQECPSGWCDLPEDAEYGTTVGYCKATAYCYDPELDPIVPESWVAAGGSPVFPPCRDDEDCAEGTSCVETPYAGEHVCWAEGDPVPLHKYIYYNCGVPACNAFYKPFQVGDAQFNDRPCTEFSFRGSTTNSYCFEPGVDPDPSEGTDLCGDFWMASVHLGTEWQLYKVPFSELHQQGWAKEQFEFDLTSVSVVRFTWGPGWIDYYLDDVRFYREKR